MEHCAEYKRSSPNQYTSLTALKQMDTLRRQEMENWSELAGSQKSDNKRDHLPKDMELAEEEISNREQITKGSL